MAKVADYLERSLPHSDELERAVLGAILAEHRQRSELLDALRHGDFLDGGPNQAIFDVLVGLYEEGTAPDLLAAHDALLRQGRLESAGGVAHLSSISDCVPLSGDMMYTVRRLREMAAYREAIRTADFVRERAFEQGGSPAQLLDMAIERLAALARDIESSEDDGISHFDAASRTLMELGQDSPKIFSDLDKLDKIIGGFRAGELVIITAETGSGKTLFAQQIRARACRDEFNSLFCSGEMLAPHLKRRELAAVAGVAPLKMRREDLLTPEDRKALIEAAAHECKKCRILDGELDLARIRRVARKMKKQPGLELVILDYDELIDAPGKDELDQQRNLVRAAKSLGMELRCAVILISQLRKPLSGEDAAKPTLQRIYGSGSKTKHASIVILADRQYVRELQGDETEAQIFILKNRDGRTGRIRASFNVKKLRFDDAEEEQKVSGRNWHDPESREA